jgi:5-methyltetrahydropteroyltriglutamate--homocysteine methyltransferase
MLRTAPPFRADHVGSLLRATALKEARSKRERGEIDADALKTVEDEEIIKLIRRQEEIGLQSVTDGEYRRASWQTDFLVGLDGVESYYGERKFKFQGPQPRPILLRLKGKLGGFSGHPMIEHFKFLARHTKATPKMTIPSPSTLHFRYGREAVPEAVYPSMDDFYHDLGTTYRKVICAFADAGCRYLQLDEVNLAYLCDPALRDQVRARGDDPDTLPLVSAGMINAAILDIPADMTITMHLCRGNFRSTFVASGGYEPIAEMLFNTIRVHGYFLEFDSARRQLRAASFRAEGQASRAGARDVEIRHARKPRRAQAPHRRGGKVRRHRRALPLAAMRLCVDRGRQRARRRGAVGEAAADRGLGERGVGMTPTGCRYP